MEIEDDGKKIVGKWIGISKLSERNVVPPGTYRHMLELMREKKG